MAKSQLVAVLREQLTRILGRIRMRYAVVQVDFDLSPPGMAVIGQHLEQALVILFGRIKVSVDKRASVVVAPLIDNFWIFARPPFQPSLLLGAWSAFLTVFRNDGGFEMISQSDDQVHGAFWRGLQRAKGRGWQDFSGVSELVFETHLETCCSAATPQAKARQSNYACSRSAEALRHPKSTARSDPTKRKINSKSSARPIALHVASFFAVCGRARRWNSRPLACLPCPYLHTI